ncbi:MAG: hypothetical protein U0T75_12505 [Chitinophagales bacterium]
MIIKSLRNYYGDNDPEVQRLNAMAEITLLFKKRLYDSALRQIESKAQLIEQELHLLYLSGANGIPDLSQKGYMRRNTGSGRLAKSRKRRHLPFMKIFATTATCRV